MTSIAVTRHIDAPPERVFAVISETEHFKAAVPEVIAVDVLSEQTSGVGTRWRETRRTGKREMGVELEITEHDPPSHLRVVSDEGGTVWDSVFTVAPSGDGSKLSLTMEARPHTLRGRISTPFVMRMIRGTLEGDLDKVKAYCEGAAEETEGSW